MATPTTIGQRIACADCGQERPAHRVTLFEGKHYCEMDGGNGCLERAWDRSGKADGRKVSADVREQVEAWARTALVADAAATVEALVAEGLAVLGADGDLAQRLADAASPALVRGEVREVLLDELGALAEREARRLLKHLTEQGVARLKGDSEQLRALLEDVLPTVIRESLEAGLRPKDGRMGAALEARAAAFGARFQRWAQHTEMVGQARVKLLDMTRGQLLEAARCRTAVAGEQLRYAALWRSLAEGLADGQVVRDRFTAQQIERLHEATEPLAKAV